VVTTFSIQDIPFSYPGSWFGISPVIAEKTYADDLHLVSHRTGLHPVLRLVTTRASRRVNPHVTANPARATGLTDRGTLQAGLRADLVRVQRAEGVPVVRAVWRAGARVA